MTEQEIKNLTEENRKLKEENKQYKEENERCKERISELKDDILEKKAAFHYAKLLLDEIYTKNNELVELFAEMFDELDIGDKFRADVLRSKFKLLSGGKEL